MEHTEVMLNELLGGSAKEFKDKRRDVGRRISKDEEHNLPSIFFSLTSLTIGMTEKE